MAIALEWKEYVDTDLKFAEFFSASHTLVLRFMPQHPNTYEGPFIGENGTGTFGVGQGYFVNGADGSTKLYLAAGTQMITPAASLTRNQWHHLAVVVTVSKTLRTFALYLNGTQLGQTLQAALNADQMPVGTLRFGKRTTGIRTSPALSGAAGGASAIWWQNPAPRWRRWHAMRTSWTFSWRATTARPTLQPGIRTSPTLSGAAGGTS